MGKKAQEILNLDVAQLIEMLNKALADEWLAYYQYWVGAKIAKGLMRPSVIAELNQHATEELGHANLLAERIIQLGGLPILDPVEWQTKAGCQYLKPSNPDVKALLTQNITSERCAIEAYQRLVDFTKDKDFVTYELAVAILKDEIEHEEDLENLLEDISSLI
jgi:bacterioferritin